MIKPSLHDDGKLPMARIVLNKCNNGLQGVSNGVAAAQLSNMYMIKTI